MVDVHCHLNFFEFSDDLPEVLSRARSVGVTQFIVIGTNLETSRKAVFCAQSEPDIVACVGIHPTEIDGLPTDWQQQLTDLASQEKVVGIGEIGLDYYHSTDPEEHTEQKEIFLQQLHIAHTLKKPIQIHNRHAGKDIVALLEEHSEMLLDTPGMMHCFAGSLDVLQRVLDLGFYIGVDGNVTYPGIAKGETVALSEIVASTPLERLLSETDSPYLAPVPYRGSRNEPAHVILVVQEIARIKNISEAVAAEQIVQNMHRVFSL